MVAVLIHPWVGSLVTSTSLAERVSGVSQLLTERSNYMRHALTTARGDGGGLCARPCKIFGAPLQAAALGRGRRSFRVRASGGLAPDEDRTGGAAGEHEGGEGGEQAAGGGVDWRTFRARLVALEQGGALATADDSQSAPQGPAEGQAGLGLAMESTVVRERGKWAHLLSQPEKGCILVASDALDGVAFFERAIVLMMNDASRETPYGVVLNKPLKLHVRDIKGLDPTVLAAFGDQPIHVGGPVDLSHLAVLQAHGPLDNYMEILPGVFIGGISGIGPAVSLVRSGHASPTDFRFFLGYSGWDMSQLAVEVDSGWWRVAACNAEVIAGSRPGMHSDTLSSIPYAPTPASTPAATPAPTAATATSPTGSTPHSKSSSNSSGGGSGGGGGASSSSSGSKPVMGGLAPPGSLWEDVTELLGSRRGGHSGASGWLSQEKGR